ncbi:MAG TPA: DUF2589 domain-containing protein [Pseudomonadales bacterium]|nr:DUF2589 domain-containing protein [Pseudomonadales bacterium]
MPINIGKEMQLPMEQIIGGPMQALIKAQSLAASTSADFINSVGLVDDGSGGKTAQMVNFSFVRKVPTEVEGGADTVEDQSVTLNVPLLTIIPVPFLRIEEATIDFEAKVSSTTLNQTSSTLGVSASASAGFWGVKLSVKTSYSRRSEFKDQVNRTATLRVHVKAVQDELPGGLARMLDILETAVNDSDIQSAA